MLKGGDGVEYITYALGMKVSRYLWKYVKKMPYYIQDKFDIEEATLGNVRTLFLRPKAELDHIKAVDDRIFEMLLIAYQIFFAHPDGIETMYRGASNTDVLIQRRHQIGIELVEHAFTLHKG